MFNFFINGLKEKLQPLKLKFLGLLAGGYIASFVSVQGIQALMPFIRREFAISRTQAGLYSTVFFISATAVALFSGNIVDKIGSRTGLLIGLYSMGGLFIFQGAAPVYGLLLVLGLLTGLGFSIITPAVNKAVMIEVEPSHRAVSMGIMHSGSGVGGFVGAAILPALAGFIGWRLSIILAGIISLLIGLIVQRYLQVSSLEEKDEENSSGKSFSRQLYRVLSNRQLMLASGLGVVFGLAVGAIPAHYTLYLTMDLNFSEAAAGLALGVVQIGGVVGRIFWGWLSDIPFKGDRKNTFLVIMITIVILNLTSAFAGSLLGSSLLLMMLLSFMLGVSALGWSGLFFTVVSERATAEQTGMASGMALVFLRLGVVIGPAIFGLLGDYFDHYRYSWLLLTVLVLISGSIYYILQSRQDRKRAEASGADS
ncbi:MFS transporter [Halarsenatibacter silvermanii]|uniref:Sugar phosphate permease n=1 Tax=Halarsenatibacter silvermanii TaxID=321763 RepID=A0A1G9Q3D5_9FIRM|nr:MFS transporter [Halarsenatibacter silvermanii]SDM05499.1 Sugar phosphate permease [Halarsenatibacter silvermanii]